MLEFDSYCQNGQSGELNSLSTSFVSFLMVLTESESITQFCHLLYWQNLQLILAQSTVYL